MAAKKAAPKTNKPANGAGGAVSATLKPVSPTPGDAAMAKPTSSHQPTAEQIAAWKALPAEQKLALREREAARVFGVGVEHHQKGEYAEAVEAYGKSLLLNPKIPDTYNNMGVALRQMGKLEASIACYRRSLVLRPNNAGAYSNMGNALRELGRLQLAVAAHQQACAWIRRAPSISTTWVWHYVTWARPTRRWPPSRRHLQWCRNTWIAAGTGR